MINKRIISLLISLAILVGTLVVPANATGDYNTAKGMFDSILSYKAYGNIQSWINGSLTQNAGVSSEWYVFTLAQTGNYDLTSYKDSLLKYISNNKIINAVTRQKYALLLMSCGSGDKFIYSTLNDSIGQGGIMSWIYGLHMLNNGYSGSYSVSEVLSKLISLQKSDGGWAVSGNYGDVDVTAMCIQALSKYYSSNSNVSSAVNRGISFLSNKQGTNGEFSSYGVENSESTSQVLVALSSLGIDCVSDTRFIKNDKTLIDILKGYSLSNGSVKHIKDGGANENATVQCFYALASYIRFKDGKNPLYIIDNANPSILEKPAVTTAAVTEKPNQETTKTTTAIVTESKPVTKAETTAKITVSSETKTDTKETFSTNAENTKESTDISESETTGIEYSSDITTDIDEIENIKTEVTDDKETSSNNDELETVDIPEKSNTKTIVIISVIIVLCISACAVIIVITYRKKKQK